MNRREQILEVAGKLFETKGYDQTSTNDIIHEIGIARGTLYHYFASKEDILDQLIEYHGRKILDKARNIAEDRTIPVMMRLFMVIQSLNVRQESEYLIEQMHQPQNALMHEKSQKLILAELPPILEIVIRDGIKEGLMATDYPLQTCEMIVSYVSAYFDDQSPEISDSEIEERLVGFSYNLEVLFATQPGTFKEIVAFAQKENHE